MVKPGKNTRVCVDLLRKFNDHLEDKPFKYSSVQAGVDLAMQCGPPAHLVKLDISSCFLSFPVHEQDLQYYVCKDEADRHMQFKRMVFGLKSAPRMASLLLDVVSSALADAGIQHVRYLDDFLIVASTAELAWASAHAAANILSDFGLALSPEKVEGPAQRLEFLGIVIDTVSQTLSISEQRRKELTSLLQGFGGRSWSSLRRVQSLLGKLNFAATVLPGARPFMRRIIDLTRGRTGGRLFLDNGFRDDVDYWLAHMAAWNGKARWRTDDGTPFVFGSDASISGFAYGLEAAPQKAVESMPSALRPGAIRMGSWSAANGDAARQNSSSQIQWGEFLVLWRRPLSMAKC